MTTADHQRAIAERMRWVIDSGRVENASAWAVAAGLHRTYVTAFIERVKKGITNDIGVNTIASLAAVAGISPAWLAYGSGPIDDGPPNLKRLMKRLGEGAYTKELLEQASMVRQLIAEADFSEGAWADYLDTLRKAARQLGLKIAGARIDRRTKRKASEA